MSQQFEIQVKEELKSMDQRLYELDERMTSIDSKLTQVVDAILGNPLTKSGGFVKELDDLKLVIKDLEKRIKDQDEKIKEQEDFKKKIVWGITILVAVAGVIQYLINLYSNFN
jgi:chromosome segregation ATPase